MKPFNLEAALAGEPLCTRDGREVNNFKLYTDKGYSKYPYVAIVKDRDKSLVKRHYTKDGKFWTYDHEADLFMLDELPEDGEHYKATFGEHSFENKAIMERAAVEALVDTITLHDIMFKCPYSLITDFIITNKEKIKEIFNTYGND